MKTVSHTKVISCDWGTSSFRLRLLDLHTGEIIQELTDRDGIAEINDRFLKTSDTSRIQYFWQILKSKCQLLSQETHPILISGMASAGIGMRELPYASLPFALNGATLHYELLNNELDYEKAIVLISGVQAVRDVMRGEETIILGAETRQNETIILPGTHSKHALISQGELTYFKTYMTGEFFSLLTDKSILKNSLTLPPQTFEYSPAFQKGVRDAAEGNLLHKTFEIRADSILNKTLATDNYAYLSGLLIGTELKDVKGPIKVIADEPHLSLYFRALEILEKAEDLTYVEAAKCFSLGHLKIARHLGL